MIGQPPTSQNSNDLTILKWLGIFLIVIGVLITGYLAIDSISLVGGAESMTVNQASEIASDSRSYVKLTDANWHCDSIAYVEGLSASDFRRGAAVRTAGTKYTDVIATDATRDIAVLITLSGKVDCDDLQDRIPSGFLYAVDTTPNTLNSSSRTLLRNADTVLTMCGYCGLSNSMIGIVMGIFFTLSGIGLMFIYIKKG